MTSLRNRLARAGERAVRRLVPSLALLTRYRVLFLPLDAIDATVGRMFPELRGIPPARFRMRTGVRWLVFNQVSYRYVSGGFWNHAFARGWLGLDSTILELGCGAGRYALSLADTTWEWGGGFRGAYTGLDVDDELLRWCRDNFPSRFRFVKIDAFSQVYNPSGRLAKGVSFPVAADSQDFVFAHSLFTHLLPEDLDRYLREAHRVMKPGTTLVASVFCIDHLHRLGRRFGGRWTFRHRAGEAWVENPRYPEAAVAYDSGSLLSHCQHIGFRDTRVEPGRQSVLFAIK